ncbi:MAG TPA: RNA polymerase sigma factor [Pirellulales bacterium]|nr:RNA polymerase sigma factor [Pirellulales bacterium]
MTLAEAGRIDPDRIAELHTECGEELRRLALGVLHDAHLAADVVQTAFAKAIEQGHTADESLRGWLFRVALNEALAVRRRMGVQTRALDKVAWWQRGPEGDGEPCDIASRREELERVKEALESLPSEQRQVVYLRLYEQKTFAAIARESNAPLGTVLWRMQAAIGRLRERLRPRDEAGPAAK